QRGHWHQTAPFAQSKKHIHAPHFASQSASPTARTFQTSAQSVRAPDAPACDLPAHAANRKPLAARREYPPSLPNHSAEFEQAAANVYPELTPPCSNTAPARAPTPPCPGRPPTGAKGADSPEFAVLTAQLHPTLSWDKKCARHKTPSVSF